MHWFRRTASRIETILSASKLNRSGTLLDNPVLSRSAVAVVATMIVNDLYVGVRSADSHLDGSAVRELGRLDIKALLGVRHWVDLGTLGWGCGLGGELASWAEPEPRLV